LAAQLAIKMKRKYDMESDWDHGSVNRLTLAAMPSGLKKIRKALWARSFLKTVDKCFSHSSLALLQGQDVFAAYKDVAPNPKNVLNVQVSSEDHILVDELERKLAGIRNRNPLTISYAGRMIAMKGPIDWLKAIHVAAQGGVELKATWFGDGSMLPLMRQEIERLGIGNNVVLPGIVDRQAIMANLKKADIFLFCHKTGVSPRCLGEALAAGCPLVGYGTAYSRALVATRGGGEFAEINDWQSLGQTIISLDQDRDKLEYLIQAAAASGALLDRDAAMQTRIDLIKKYLPPHPNSVP